MDSENWRDQCLKLIRHLAGQPDLMPLLYKMDPDYGEMEFSLIVKTQLDIETVLENVTKGGYENIR